MADVELAPPKGILTEQGQLTEDGFGGLLAAVDAVGKSDPLIGVPGQSKARPTVHQASDLGQPVFMPDRILRHTGRPPSHQFQAGLALDTEETAEFGQDQLPQIPILQIE